MDKKNYYTSNETLKNENKSWDKDNQAWWDWYVSLADNSNSGKNNTFLELPEPPKIKYPAQIELKKQLSRPKSRCFNIYKPIQCESLFF